MGSTLLRTSSTVPVACDDLICDKSSRRKVLYEKALPYSRLVHQSSSRPGYRGPEFSELANHAQLSLLCCSFNVAKIDLPSQCSQKIGPISGSLQFARLFLVSGGPRLFAFFLSLFILTSPIVHLFLVQYKYI